MKKIGHFIFAGIALFMLTACPKDPIEPPTPDSTPQEKTNGEEIVDGGNTEGKGIDDLHGTQTDKPAYRRQ